MMSNVKLHYIDHEQIYYIYQHWQEIHIYYKWTWLGVLIYAIIIISFLYIYFQMSIKLYGVGIDVTTSVT